MSSEAKDSSFVFTKENFRNPSLPSGLRVVEVCFHFSPVCNFININLSIPAWNHIYWGASGRSNRRSSWRVSSLSSEWWRWWHWPWWWKHWWWWQWSFKRYGRVLNSKEECSIERGNFEIKPWPVQASIRSYYWERWQWWWWWRQWRWWWSGLEKTWPRHRWWGWHYWRSFPSVVIIIIIIINNIIFITIIIVIIITIILVIIIIWLSAYDQVGGWLLQRQEHRSVNDQQLLFGRWINSISPDTDNTKAKTGKQLKK